MFTAISEERAPIQLTFQKTVTFLITAVGISNITVERVALVKFVLK
jgi:hypothetical protein